MATEQEPKKKSRKKEIFRMNNELDDAHLCEKSRVWHALFGDRLAQFSAFDSQLDAAFALNWLAQTEAFEAFPTDRTMLAGIEEKTAGIALKVKATRLVVDDLEYYTDRAFPEDARIKLEFGFARLRWGITKGDGRWVLPSFTLGKVMQDYLPQLLAAGLPVNLQTGFNTALDNLGTAEVDQEYEKRLRIKATTARIKMYNTLYGMHVRVRNAARIIFQDNPTVLKQYEL